MEKFLIVLSVHLIGAILCLIHDIVKGKFRDAVQNGDVEPSEIVFMDLVLWEIMLPFVFMGWLDDTINKIFEKKYSGE